MPISHLAPGQHAVLCALRLLQIRGVLLAAIGARVGALRGEAAVGGELVDARGRRGLGGRRGGRLERRGGQQQAAPHGRSSRPRSEIFWRQNSEFAPVRRFGPSGLFVVLRGAPLAAPAWPPPRTRHRFGTTPTPPRSSILPLQHRHAAPLERRSVAADSATA
jgi:hypothetical protein